MIEFEFDLTGRTLVVLDQDVVMPPHQGSAQAGPHPAIPDRFARLAARCRVALYGRYPAMRLHELLGVDEVAYVGLWGLETWWRGELALYPGLGEAPAHVAEFAATVPRWRREQLAARGITFEVWQRAISISWRSILDDGQCHVVAERIQEWALREAALYPIWRHRCLDLLPVDPQDSFVVGELARRTGASGVMHVHESVANAKASPRSGGLRQVVEEGRDGLPAINVEVLLGGEPMPHERGLQMPPAILVTGSVRSVPVTQPLDGIAGVVGMLDDLVRAME